MTIKVDGFDWKPVGNTNHTKLNPIGLCLHVAVGNGSLFGEFNNPSSRASSNFWAAKAGGGEQYVSMDEQAWCQGAGNSLYASVETEGFPTEALTDAQIDSIAKIYAVGHQKFNWALKITDTPGQGGFILHGDGGVPWGNHPMCPGQIRAGQRAAILTKAGSTDPGSSSDSSSSSSSDPATAILDALTGGLGAVLKPIISKLAGVFEVAAGGALMLFGLYIIISNSKTGKASVRTGKSAVKIAKAVR